MFGNVEVALTKENGKPFFYSKVKIKKEVEELKKILLQYPFLRKIDELKIMKSTELFVESSRRKAYFQLEGYIFNHSEITDLSIVDIHEKIDPEDKYYRTDNVYIVNGDIHGIPTDFDKGISPEFIRTKMNELLNYINQPGEKNEINDFIKSQIIHFFFTYIHPFHDGNGRCARTLSKWYLLNHNTYFLSLVNRGLLTNREEYKKSVIKSRKGDLSPMIECCLKALIKECKIEIKIKEIEEDRNIKFNEEEYHTLQYLYHLNDKTLDNYKRIMETFEGYQVNDNSKLKRLYSLIEKGIISMNEGRIEIINDEKIMKRR